MTYLIQYHYTTGDSESSYEKTDALEFEWQDVNIAKQNLIRIKEHYSQYQEINHSFPRYRQQDQQYIFKKNKDKDWFVNKPRLIAYTPGDKGNYNAIDEKDITKVKESGYKVEYIIDSQTAENQVILYMDNGNPVQFWAPWCGYFETLHSAEIIHKSEEDNEFKVYF